MSEPRGPDTEYSRLRLILLPVCLVASLIFGSAFASAAPAGLSFAYSDKLAHFFFYGLVGTLVFRALRVRFLSHRRWALAFLITMSLGIGEEVVQHFNPNRSFELADWAADTAGALVAIALYRNWDLYRRVLEFRLWPRLAKRDSANSNSRP